jgi:hypothetical protein
MTMNAFALIPLIPLLFYLADGYYESNVTRGLLYIGMFSILIALTISLLYLIGWTLALYAPLFLIVMICVKPKNKSNKTNTTLKE